MPYVPATVFANDTVIDPVLVAAEFTGIAVWLNGGVLVGDITGASIRSEHIFRPEITGFPKNGSEGQLQAAYEQHHGLNEEFKDGSRTSAGAMDLAPWRNRRSMFLGGGRMPFKIADAAKRLFIDAPHNVEIRSSFWATTQYNDEVAVPPVYPDNAGEFVVRYKEVGTTTTVTLNETRRFLQPYATVSAGSSTTKIPTGHYSARGCVLALAAGTWDFWLEYQRQGASLAIEQVIIGVTNFDVGVQRG